DENVSSTRAMRYQNQGTDRIVATVGEATLSYDINIVVRNLVVGNVTLNGTARAVALTFDGPDRRAVDATATGFEVYLIPGSYAVTGSGMIGADQYAFMSMAAIPSATNLSFPLMKATTVSGMALVNGVSIPGPMPVSVVTLTGRGGGAISAQATADSSGSYAVPLAPGTYDVYVTRSFGSAVFLARITVPHAASFAHDLPLSQGFLLSGTVRNPSGAPMS